MTDADGTPLCVGAEVVVLTPRSRKPTPGRWFVRAISVLRNEVWIDDGDASNADLNTNKFTVTQWISTANVRRRADHA